MGGQIARLAEVLFGESQPILGGRDVGGHRSQCGRVELVVQLGHSLFSRFDARGQVDDLLSQGVQARRCVDHQVTHFFESLPLRLQFDIGACRGNDDLGQQLAPLLPGLRYRVVELLTHGECLGQSRFGVVHGTGERLGTLFAELLNRQRQLVGAGAYRVVDVDDFPSRQVVERAQRQPRQRIGVGGVNSFGRGQLGGAPSAAPVTHKHIRASTATRITPSPISSGAVLAGCWPRSSPLAAATAAPLQSPRRNAGSIWLRRRSSTWPPLIVCTRFGTRNA